MKKIIVSFKPEVFPSLLTKEKKFEYRSRIPEGELCVYLYLSSPIKMIVGKLMLGERISISELMNSAEYEYARNNLERHMSEGSKFCSPIISISLFQNPISLAEAKQLSSDFCVPQSFIYTSKYSKLSEELEARKADTYNINSSKSLEMLGLFSYEIIEKFPIKIALPDYLGKYKAFEKCDFYRLE